MQIYTVNICLLKILSFDHFFKGQNKEMNFFEQIFYRKSIGYKGSIKNYY
jgi:hypothetical protein